MKTYRVFISGSVSGMTFKKHIEDQARALGVRGFVRSMEDGRVEVLIEGKDDVAKEMIEVCRQGTTHAQVRECEIREINHQGIEGFKVLKL